MLVLILSWVLLLAVSFEIGAAILDLNKETAFRRIGDRFVISVWLGILVIANLLLAVAIVSRLSLLVLLMLCLGLILVSVLSGSGLRLRTLAPSLSPGMIVSFAALLIAVSYVTTQVVTWYDTGLYHFAIIKWLSRYGAVPGLALLYYGFGYTSSWFALAASFNDWFLDARASALTGGFAFLMLIVHLWVCLVRALAGRAKVEDWFIIIASVLALAVITRYEIYVSPSLDLPVIILTIVTAWSIFLLSESGSRAGVVPLLLAAGAVTIKLSALPIWLAAACFALFSGQGTVRRALTFAALTGLILLPFLTVQTINSGCLSYPSTLVCFDLPWTIGADRTREIFQQVLKAAQWSTVTPPKENSWGWLWQWPLVEKYQTGLILLAVFCLLFLRKKVTRDHLDAAKWPLIMGVVGSIYAFLLGPTWRYSLGYLAVIPGIFLSPPCEKNDSTAQVVLSRLRAMIPVLSTPAAILLGLSVTIPLVSMAVNNLKAFNYLRMEIQEAATTGQLSAAVYDRPRLLLPPSILNFSLGAGPPGGKLLFTVKDLELSREKANDVVYYKPKSGFQCWNVELPCSEALTYQEIRLRDPRSGIAKGFMRAR